MENQKLDQKLSQGEMQRYSRQIINESIGVSGQEKIKSASVLVIGVGGLGSPAAKYLAAAGVGRIGIIDFDIVDISNLQRQILYFENQVGQPKAIAAKKNLQELNSNIQIDAYHERLDIHNALELFKKYDLILDGADNFSTRYLTNDAAFFAKRPLISASVLNFEGQLGVFNWHSGPCYRCLYPEPPPAGTVPSCAEAGVLGALPGVLGSLQAAEALKIVLGLKPSVEHLLIDIQLLSQNFSSLKIKRNPNCPLCGENPSIKNLSEINFVCQADLKNNTNKFEITVQDLKDSISQNKYQLLDVRENFEVEICKISGAIQIPLQQIESQWTQLSQETPMVIYCKSGSRSQKACESLRKKGFTCYNLKGGILEWINKIEPTLQKY